MPVAMSALSWVSMLMLVIPLAVLLLWALPSGAVLLIGAHAALLVAGAAIVLALAPRTE
jgi:hypothetical protein